MLERISSRRVCVDCGTNYSVQAPPGYDWTCDMCGGEVVQREDDTPDAVRKRLDLYDKETEPLIAYFERLADCWSPSTASDRPTRSPSAS